MRPRFKWTPRADGKNVLNCTKCGGSQMLITHGEKALKKGKHHGRIVATCTSCSAEDVVKYGAPD